MSARDIEIVVQIKDGKLAIDGKGGAADFLAVAEAALFGGVSVSNPTCACDGCVGLRQLHKTAADLMRGLGGEPAGDIRETIACDAPALPQVRH